MKKYIPQKYFKQDNDNNDNNNNFDKKENFYKSDRNKVNEEILNFANKYLKDQNNNINMNLNNDLKNASIEFKKNEYKNKINIENLKNINES